MFNCHCENTRGCFVRISVRKKLWICDLCKGCKEIVVEPFKARFKSINDPNLMFLLRRYRARLAER